MTVEPDNLPVTTLFTYAAKEGVTNQWYKGLDVLAELVWNMEGKLGSKSWGKVGINFRNAVNAGEIVVVGDFGYLAKRGRETALQSPMSVYPKNYSEKDGVVLFIINRNAWDITTQGGEAMVRREAYIVNSSLNRLSEIKRRGLDLVTVGETDDDSLAKLGLSCVLNDVLEEKIRQFDTLG